MLAFRLSATPEPGPHGESGSFMAMTPKEWSKRVTLAVRSLSGARIGARFALHPADYRETPATYSDRWSTPGAFPRQIRATLWLTPSRSFSRRPHLATNVATRASRQGAYGESPDARLRERSGRAVLQRFRRSAESLR